MQTLQSAVPSAPVNLRNSDDLTQARLREVLSYDPLTGEFRWLYNSRNTTIGAIAGYKCLSGYINIGIDGGKYRGHRLAWLYTYGRWPYEECDHEDMNRANNVLANLRECTHQQNMANRRAQSNNKLGIKGVRERNSGFEACIALNGKQLYLGMFTTVDAAQAAHALASREAFGSFARVS